MCMSEWAMLNAPTGHYIASFLKNPNVIPKYIYWSFCVQCLFKAIFIDTSSYFADTPLLNSEFNSIFLCPTPSAIFQQNINFLIYTTTSIASICLCNSLFLLKIIKIFEILSSIIERFTVLENILRVQKLIIIKI